MPAQGGREQKISSFGDQPRWSPDGSKILFVDGKVFASFEAVKIYVMDWPGGAPQEVRSQVVSELHEFLLLGWHPDGRRISFTGGDSAGHWGFWTMAIDGSPPVRSELAPEVDKQMREALDSPPERPYRCYWAPSGRALYFEGVSKGSVNLWRVVVDPETLRWIAGPERLTTGAGH